MIRDADEHDEQELDYDVCIVGSGPAGATVAAELADSGLAICVLESGRMRPTRHGDLLKEVTSDGIHVKDYSRERVLGGASTTWAGLSSPLDPADLEPRDFLESPGWPLPHDELSRFYGEAAERYRFPPLDFFGADGFGALKADGDLRPEWTNVEEKVFLAAGEPQNFGREQRHVYADGPVDLWLDATLLRLEGDREARTATSALVRTRGGRELRVRARAFVLAAGGIENARLMLLSRDLCDAGLGNEHDQVGRWFMNHPKNYHGILKLAEPVAELPYFFGCIYRGYAGYAGLRLTEEVQRERGLLNSYVRMEPLFPWSDSQGIEALVTMVKRTKFLVKGFVRSRKGEVVELRDYSETGDDSDLQNVRKSPLDWLRLVLVVLGDLPRVSRYLWWRLVARRKPLVREVRVRNFMDMEPSPENRVTLSDELDPYGQPRAHAHHAPTERDRRSLVVLHEELVRELAEAGVGALETSLADEDPWPIVQDASHHMGTTRMGTDPATSVVDPDCRVHGARNVWVAGASVFPTSGCANPTFTIVALAIRLARHLRNVAPARRVDGAERAAR
jgi:choline dehydrogenase-like flavoprotein